MTITPEQLTTARALLEWSREELATKVGISSSTITDFEEGASKPSESTLSAIKSALEAGGINFMIKSVKLRKKARP